MQLFRTLTSFGMKSPGVAAGNWVSQSRKSASATLLSLCAPDVSRQFTPGRQAERATGATITAMAVPGVKLGHLWLVLRNGPECHVRSNVSPIAPNSNRFGRFVCGNHLECPFDQLTTYHPEVPLTVPRPLRAARDSQVWRRNNGRARAVVQFDFYGRLKPITLRPLFDLGQ
jgi:hypothetical protein